MLSSFSLALSSRSEFSFLDEGETTDFLSVVFVLNNDSAAADGLTSEEEPWWPFLSAGNEDLILSPA